MLVNAEGVEGGVVWLAVVDLNCDKAVGAVQELKARVDWLRCGSFGEELAREEDLDTVLEEVEARSDAGC